MIQLWNKAVQWHFCLVINALLMKHEALFDGAALAGYTIT